MAIDPNAPSADAVLPVRRALLSVSDKTGVLELARRLAAAGDHRAIRDAMADRPRHVLVRASDGRRLAAALVAIDAVAGVTFDASRHAVVVQTVHAGELATALPRLAQETAVRLLEVRPLDDSLESLFRELVR